MRYLDVVFCLFLEKINSTMMNPRKIIYLILFLPLSLLSQENNKQYFVFLNSNPNKEVLDTSRVNDLQRRHLANISRLYAEEKIVAAGPFYGGGGLFIFQESSIDNVNTLLKSDPAIAANRFLLEVYPMEFVLGSIGKYIEPIEMLSYSFISIQKAKNKLVSKKIKDLQLKYDKKVLCAAIFNNHSGGFMLLEMNHEILEAQFNSEKGITDPALILKRLYIAKGTFQRDSKK